MAIVTYIPRALPLTLFKKNIESKFVKSFLYYTPYAVLGSMTFPSILYSTNNVPASIFGTIVALFLAYYNRSLLTVASISVATVYISTLIFKM